MNAKHLKGDETSLCNFLHRNKTVLCSTELLWVKGLHRIFQHDVFYLTLSVKYRQKKKYLSHGKIWDSILWVPEGGLWSFSDSSAVTVLWKKKYLRKTIQTVKQHKCSINPTYVIVLKRKQLCNSAVWKRQISIRRAISTKRQNTKHKDHQQFAYFLLHIN